jgi:hypothetical protein
LGSGRTRWTCRSHWTSCSIGAGRAICAILTISAIGAIGACGTNWTRRTCRTLRPTRALECNHRVGHGHQRLSRHECRERTAAGGRTHGDLQPALVAVEHARPEVQVDRQQAVDEVDVVGAQQRADLAGGQARAIVQAELEVGGGVRGVAR